MMHYYYSPFDILLLPALILSIWAQLSVSGAFKKYGAVRNSRGITGRETASRILSANGIGSVPVLHTGGELTDNYNPVNNTVNLSDGVYDSASVAAVGIAAHECGHAMQHSTGYLPIKIRNAVLPAVQLSSKASMPLFILGLLFSLRLLVTVGIALFSAAVFFQLVTLPVEFNASARALRTIKDMDILDESEYKGARKVLRAAAMTYVAAAAMAALQLLRLIAISDNNRRR